jgi:hypothetical protein
MIRTLKLEESRRYPAWLVLAGVASPVLLSVTSLAVAAGRPEYSHVSQTLSELGARGRAGALWMNWFGIVPAGFLIPVCAPGLYRAFGKGRNSTTGSILLGAGGACLGGSGLTPWQGGLPPDLSIPGNVAHLSLAVAGFLLIALAPLLFGLQARSTLPLSQWSRMSFAASVLTFVSAFAPSRAYPGALQRAALILFYTWLSAASIWAWRQSRFPSWSGRA